MLYSLGGLRLILSCFRIFETNTSSLPLLQLLLLCQVFTPISNIKFVFCLFVFETDLVGFLLSDS